MNKPILPDSIRPSVSIGPIAAPRLAVFTDLVGAVKRCLHRPLSPRLAYPHGRELPEPVPEKAYRNHLRSAGEDRPDEIRPGWNDYKQQNLDEAQQRCAETVGSTDPFKAYLPRHEPGETQAPAGDQQQRRQLADHELRSGICWQ